ncbi:MAG: hypothetical protein ABL920_04540 [Methylotenera sp.]|jgi:hypothetical protein|nr:hypothetical protein [Methylotenera sp.]NOT65583.1 hypothetical protein [Methylotenera sp.]
MKPVRRRIRKHFGLTAKQVAVRSHRPWYFRWVIAALFLVLGYSFAYWQYAAGGKSLVGKLKLATIENQNLQSKVIQTELKLQIEAATQADLNKQLNVLHDENIKIKEDLLFYKNVVGKMK